MNEPDARELYRRLRISVPVDGHDIPKNIGLLFFSQKPERFFPGARIEVVQFGQDDSSTILSERIFNNRPVHEQAIDSLTHLEGFSSRWIEKRRIGRKPRIGSTIRAGPCGKLWSTRFTTGPTKILRSR